MEPLSIEDRQQLDGGIQQLYTLHNLDTFGVNALTIVDRLIPSEVPLFHVTDVQTCQVWHTWLPGFPGLSPELHRIHQQYLGEHPIAQRMPQTLDGAYKLSDFVSCNELHRLEGVYQQFLRELGIEEQMLLFLPNVRPNSWEQLARSATTLDGFILNRPQRNFTERDRSMLNLLRPHLTQAYANSQQYDRLQQDLDRIQQSLHHLGAIVVDPEGRIQSIAPQAIIWLETYFPQFTSALGLPDHLWSWVNYQVTCLADLPDLNKPCLPLRIQQDGRELTIRLVIEPLRNRYILLLEEQTKSSLNSLALLGLSQRETEVLALVIQGKDNKTIASQLSVHPSTIRKHLENIYTKWSVKSRTEAIAQALEKLGFLNSLPPI